MPETRNPYGFGFPVEADATCTPDRFRRYEIHPVTLLATLKPTTDQARFFARDRIAEAENAGSKPGKVIGSATSVNDCRLSKRAKVKVRVPNNVTITGGRCITEDRADQCAQWGHKATIASKRNVKSGRKANNREVRKRALIRELQARGYAV